MKIYNTEKKEVVTLEIIDPQTNTNMASDIVGNSWHDLSWIKIDGEEFLSGNDGIVSWWVNYCNEYDTANSDIYDFLNEYENLREEYHNFVGGVEFNDIPSAINNFITDKKYEILERKNFDDLNKILETTYIQEWFVGRSFGVVVEDISAEAAVSIVPTEKWLIEQVVAFNDLNETVYHLPTK